MADHALVIVESPTKARTIRKFLGNDYTVEASMGHVRDLPSSADEIPQDIRGKSWARMAVNVDENFEPIYVIPDGKKKLVADLKRALKDANRLYIATDEDREGEAIGWHLLQLLKPKIPTYRMVFHEITREAIARSLQNTRELDESLVQAQEARRILDRLVGYEVSPLLWKKIAPKLSAGRVQSVAVRLLVQKERDRIAFVSSSWWDLLAQTEKNGQGFEATVTALGGKPLATGKDFDDSTGALKNKRCLCLSGDEAEALAQRLKGCQLKVTEIDAKPSERSPYPPFTTSTLQQESNRKLGLSAQDTMKIAQHLYENGHITYMRTDSVNLSNEAIDAARKMIERRYGANYLQPKARHYQTKSKGAQEAHEAIRPAGTQMATAEELGLSGLEARLYDLIWKRTAATQMANAKILMTHVTLETEDPANGQKVLLKASGRQVLFDGFLRAYVNGNDDPADALDDSNTPLPQLNVGDLLPCLSITAQSHETRPPARFTEATLVKKLEELGIGRPSTYASIISTIQNRGYVLTVSRYLQPTFTAFAVTKLLEETLSQVVDVDFTAEMEAWLDKINSKEDEIAYLRKFYDGYLLKSIEQGEAIDPRSICTLHYNTLGSYDIRIGRYGPFVEAEVQGERKTIALPDTVAPADVNQAYIEDLFSKSASGNIVLGNDPESGEEIRLCHGRFGPYLQRGSDPKTAKNQSLPPGISPGEVNLSLALKILELPRTLGEHPEGGTVKVGLGKFGPYVLYLKPDTPKGIYASLTKEDDLMTIDLPRALELLSQKKIRGQKAAPLRVLGEHPADGEPIEVHSGRFGPYVKHGKTNATLPRGVSENEITLEQALLLIQKKEEAGTTAKKTTRKTAKAAATEEEAPVKVTRSRKKAEPAEPAAEEKPKRTRKKAEPAAEEPAEAPKKTTRSRKKAEETAEEAPVKVTRSRKKAEAAPAPEASEPAVAPVNEAPVVAEPAATEAPKKTSRAKKPATDLYPEEVVEALTAAAKTAAIRAQRKAAKAKEDEEDAEKKVKKAPLPQENTVEPKRRRKAEPPSES